MTAAAPAPGAFRCKNHPDRDGVGICVPCRRVVCADCSTRLDGINHCRECLEAKIGKARRAPGRSRKAVERVAAAGFVLVAYLVLVGAFYLVGASASGIAWFGAGSRLTKTARNMQVVADGLRRFRDDVGRFPTEREGLRALEREDPEPDTPTPIEGWNGPYLPPADAGESPLVDGFGTPLRYAGGDDPTGPAIVSLGGDRKLETDLGSLRYGDPGAGDDRVLWVEARK
jgi:hypothetical protein